MKFIFGIIFLKASEPADRSYGPLLFKFIYLVQKFISAGTE